MFAAHARPLADLLDLVLPRRCVECGRPLGLLCSGCWPAGPLVWGPDAVAATGYDGAVRTALLAYKERGRRDLAAVLARLLAGPVRGVIASGRAPPWASGADPAARVVLVPVPSARSVARARGGDHVRRLARRTAVLTGTQVAPGALSLIRPVRDSAGLGVGARALNVRAAMAARPAPAGRVAVVVDDIVTSGATLREAVRALGEAGWPVLGCAVVAATARRSTRGESGESGDWQGGGNRSSVRTT